MRMHIPTLKHGCLLFKRGLFKLRNASLDAITEAKDIMFDKCEQTIERLWPVLSAAATYLTAEGAGGNAFGVTAGTATSITITPQAFSITKRAFVAAIAYLCEYRHDYAHPCAILSNDDPHLSGGLCLAARAANRQVRCINYILPILARAQVVVIEASHRPNTTWLLPTQE